MITVPREATNLYYLVSDEKEGLLQPSYSTGETVSLVVQSGMERISARDFRQHVRTLLRALMPTLRFLVLFK